MSRETVKYYVSRDSWNGVMSDTCDVWRTKPIRVRHATRVAWVHGNHTDPGHAGRYPVEDITKSIRTQPDTDLELIVVEQYELPKKKTKKIVK